MMAQMSTPPITRGVVMEDPSIKQMHRDAIKKIDKEAEKKKRDDDIYYLLS